MKNKKVYQVGYDYITKTFIIDDEESSIEEVTEIWDNQQGEWSFGAYSEMTRITLGL